MKSATTPSLSWLGNRCRIKTRAPSRERKGAAPAARPGKQGIHKSMVVQSRA